MVMVLGQAGSSFSSARGVPRVPPGHLPLQHPDPQRMLQALPHRHRLLERSRKHLLTAHRLWKFTTISSFFSDRASLLWARRMDLMSSMFTRPRLPAEGLQGRAPRVVSSSQPRSCSRDGAAGTRAFNIFPLLWEIGTPVRRVGAEAAASAPVDRERTEGLWDALVRTRLSPPSAQP